MKHKIFALILAMTVAAWAQTATPNTPATGATAEKAKASCCDKMSSGKKDGMSCPRHKTADAKETASCCGGKTEMSCCAGKDAKSCTKDDKTAASCKDACGKNQMASGCCGDKCSKDGKSCCSDKNEKTAMSCCAKHQ